MSAHEGYQTRASSANGTVHVTADTLDADSCASFPSAFLNSLCRLAFLSRSFC
jgi:hypothetical protein